MTLLTRKPYSSTASLILPRMWRHILAISAYQLIMMLTLLAVANDRFGITPQFLYTTGKWIPVAGQAYPDQHNVDMYRSTFIFNAFVFAQVR
jgi:hypothetical protein